MIFLVRFDVLRYASLERPPGKGSRALQSPCFPTKGR